ncbi:MAG: hypothetical protein HC897_16055, partial [Thermoanaerobaculia bacterium]|nr:hypothetical protein [Thermoanaerobaculia bacterium]
AGAAAPAAAAVNAKGGLEDQTPICNYLDRGINDFTLNWGDVDTTLRRIDHYSVIPQQLPNLEAIDFLQFGLDLPLTHCKNAAHSVPCADKDLTLDWCLNEVGLSVLGYELYHGQAPGCLLDVEAGLNGIRTLSGAELRNNPLWGFTQDQLTELYSYFNLEDLTFQIPRLTIEGRYLELLVESTIGHLLARDAKGCDNPLYCGDHGKLGASLADEADADCDFGDCDTNRLSSPWVEVKGNEDKLRVDVDLKIASSLPDVFDKQTNDGKVYFGQNWQQWSHGSLQFDLGFPCLKSYRVLVDAGDPEDPADDQWQKLRDCAQDATVMCFQPDGEGTSEGSVQCPEGEDSTLCGLAFATSEPSHALAIELGTPTFDGEGGIIPEGLITKTLQERLDTAALSGLALIKDLPACPLVFTFFNGDVVIDFTGNPNFEGGIKIEHPATQAMGKSLAQKPTIAAKGTVPPPRRVSADWLAEMAYDRRTLTRAGKMPMEEIDGVIVQLCAASMACNGNYAPDDATLELLLNVDFQKLETLLAAECADQACWQNLVTSLNELIGFVFYDPAFAQGCVGLPSVPDPADPAKLIENIAYLFEVKKWYTEKFQVFATNDCRELGIEGYFPTLAMILSLGTADHEVSDGFAFVNFQQHTFAPGDDPLKADRCEHIENFVAAPSKAPVCGDDGRIASGPGQGEWCGSVVGGPCRDIRGPAAELPGQSPEDPGYHPNGDYRWYTRCDDDPEGHAMACTEAFFPGAGNNYTGVCKRCGVPGLNDDPADFTMIGCELDPTPLDECPQGLYLQPDGRCWDIDTGVPEWECEADCAGMYNDYGWCVHHGPWRDWMSDEHPFFAQYEQTYDHPICAEHTSCPDSGVGCAAEGTACQPDDGICAMECVSNADCVGIVPAPATPTVSSVISRPTPAVCPDGGDSSRRRRRRRRLRRGQKNSPIWPFDEGGSSCSALCA